MELSTRFPTDRSQKLFHLWSTRGKINVTMMQPWAFTF